MAVASTVLAVASMSGVFWPVTHRHRFRGPAVRRRRPCRRRAPRAPAPIWLSAAVSFSPELRAHLQRFLAGACAPAPCRPAASAIVAELEQRIPDAAPDVELALNRERFVEASARPSAGLPAAPAARRCCRARSRRCPGPRSRGGSPAPPRWPRGRARADPASSAPRPRCCGRARAPRRSPISR